MFNEEVIANLNQIAQENFYENIGLTQFFKALIPVLRDAGIKLKFKNVQEWLIANDYIYDTQYGRRPSFAPTEKGSACGIVEASFDNNGYITYYCSYPLEARLFIVSKLEEIYEPIRLELERLEAEKAKKKELAAAEKEAAKAQKELLDPYKKELKAIKANILKRLRLGETSLAQKFDQELALAVKEQPERLEQLFWQNELKQSILKQLEQEEAKRTEEIRKVLATAEDYTPSEEAMSVTTLNKALNEHYQLVDYKFNTLDIARLLQEAELAFYNENHVLIPTEEGALQGISLKEGVETKGPKEGQTFIYAFYNTNVQNIILQLIKNNF